MIGVDVVDLNLLVRWLREMVASVVPKEKWRHWFSWIPSEGETREPSKVRHGDCAGSNFKFVSGRITKILTKDGLEVREMALSKFRRVENSLDDEALGQTSVRTFRISVLDLGEGRCMLYYSTVSQG